MFFRIVNSTILFSDEFQPYFDNTIENIGGTSDITDDEWALLISQPSVDSADMLEVAGANRSTEWGSDEPCTSHIGITKTEKRKITTESMESQTAMSNKKKKKDDLVPLDYDNVEPDQWVMVIYKDQEYLGQCVAKQGQFKSTYCRMWIISDFGPTFFILGRSSSQAPSVCLSVFFSVSQ